MFLCLSVNALYTNKHGACSILHTLDVCLSFSVLCILYHDLRHVRLLWAMDLDGGDVFGDIGGISLQHLTEGNDMPSGEEQTCPLCLTSSTMRHPFKPQQFVRFVKQGKDEFCHTAHMLLYGEMKWSDLWPSAVMYAAFKVASLYSLWSHQYLPVSMHHLLFRQYWVIVLIFRKSQLQISSNCKLHYCCVVFVLLQGWLLYYFKG